MPNQQMVSPVTAFVRFWTTWTADGRASRSELWFTFVANFVVTFALGVLLGLVSQLMGFDVLLPSKVLQGLISLAAIFPGFCLWARRLHDIGKSGWYILLALIPIAGPIIMLVFGVMPSQPQENQYGPVPNVR